LVTQVIQLQQNFLESGLSTVAARLTRSRYLHIREVGLLPTWSKPQDEQLRIRMCVPSHLAQRRADYLSRLGATKVDYSSQYDLDLLWRITSEFAVERNLYIIRSQVSLSSLLTTIHYLEGRVAGRWWLRMLSIVAK
jgi:hypothetical protein